MAITTCFYVPVTLEPEIQGNGTAENQTCGMRNGSLQSRAI